MVKLKNIHKYFLILELNMKKIILSVMLLASSMVAVNIESSNKEVKKNGWILSADTDQDRFALIQKYLRGFDQPMWEVGERYKQLYDAINRNNPDFAMYQWKKIKLTIENGIMKRPKRAATAKAIFLQDMWPAIQKTFQTREPQKMREGFEKAKMACVICHDAELMPYLNNQPMFDLTFK